MKLLKLIPDDTNIQFLKWRNIAMAISFVSIVLSIVLVGVGLGLLVHPGVVGLAAFVGAGLTFAGATGFCGMARLLAHMPWNRPARA